MANRSRPFWSQSVSLTTAPVAVLLPDGWGEVKVFVDALSFGQVGSAYTPPAVANVSGVITIQTPGSPTSGHFRLRVWASQTDVADTADIAFDASAATIKTALLNTGFFASADIAAGGGALPTDVTLTFSSAYAGGIPRIGVVGSTFDAGGALVRITTQPAGNGGYGYLASGVQEVWTADRQGNRTDRYIYLATVASTGTAYVTAYD